VIPVVNENDAVADEEIRFGDNDRLAALVASLIGASTLVLLTDTAGVLTADPRFNPGATLIAEITTLDDEVMSLASGSSSGVGSGGMTSKLAAARIAQWSGVTTVIAPARAEHVVTRVAAGESGLGTTIVPRPDRLSARKAWIAFALPTRGRVVVNPGAAEAVLSRGSSLLAVGVTAVEGDFSPGDAIDIVDAGSQRLAKGVTRVASDAIGEGDLVVHRDELVVLK
jgi:glutamate 5-kinase